MDLSSAASLARRLMNEHGLGHVPFEFDRAKSRLGVCSFRKVDGTCVKIGLSSYWTAACDEAEVTDTILHEIAHALAGIGHNHDAYWRSIARSLGATSMRCATPSAEAKAHVAKAAPAAWTGVCPKGHTTQMHRAPGRVKSCSQCSPRFNKANLFTWSHNGRVVPISSMPAKFRAEYNHIVNGAARPVAKPKARSLEDMFRF